MAVGQPFLILGPWGAGVNTALNAFSDLGYSIVNGVDSHAALPVLQALRQNGSAFALALRIGTQITLDELQSLIATMRQDVPDLKILTLRATEMVLTQRYMRSQKPHPFEVECNGLQSAIIKDMATHQALKSVQDFSIETSQVTPRELFYKIAKLTEHAIENPGMTVYLVTFGYKYGLPLDAEMVFDMRFITNPFYDEALRPMTGLDKPVRDYIFKIPLVKPFFGQWSGLIAQMLPLYQTEGKTRLTIGIGCTGGKHRSVCMAEALAEYLKTNCPGFHVVITHREMLRWGQVGVQPDVLQNNPTCPVGESSQAC